MHRVPETPKEINAIQAKIENELAKSSKSAVLYFGRYRLPYLQVNPAFIEEREFEGKTLLRKRPGHHLPKALRQTGIEGDRERLSAFLSRVKSMREMLEAGVRIIAVSQMMSRGPRRTGIKRAFHQIASLLTLYPSQIEMIGIEKDLCDHFVADVPMASYRWIDENGRARMAVVLPPKTKAPGTEPKIEYLFDEAAQPHIEKLNDFMRDLNGRLSPLSIPMLDELVRANPKAAEAQQLQKISAQEEAKRQLIRGFTEAHLLKDFLARAEPKVAPKQQTTFAEPNETAIVREEPKIIEAQPASVRDENKLERIREIARTSHLDGLFSKKLGNKYKAQP